MQERRVGLLAVGVDRPGILHDLKGAAQGAQNFALWLQTQQAFGVSVKKHVLTDEDNQSVGLGDVQDASAQLVVAGDLDLLFFYFSGHGFDKSAGQEQLMLSNSDRYTFQAISVLETANNASSLGIPHVIIIYDACRNAVNSHGSLGKITGSTAVRGGPVGRQGEGKVDIFFAAKPTETAKELNSESFFTKVLLDVLHNPPAQVCETWPDKKLPVICAGLLEDHLVDEVSRRAYRETPRFEQTPQIWVYSRNPLFFGYAPPQAPVMAAGALEPLKVDVGHRLESIKHMRPFKHARLGNQQAAMAVDQQGQQTQTQPQDLERSYAETIRKPRQALNSLSARFQQWGEPGRLDKLLVQAGLMDEVTAYISGAALGRSTVPLTGYHIIGAKVKDVLRRPKDTVGLIEENPAGTTIHLSSTDDHPNSHSIIVIFDAGTMVVLPVMTGYVGTVHVSEGLVQSMSFQQGVAPDSMPEETRSDVQQSGRKQAIAAAFASTGKLRLLAGNDPSDFGPQLLQDQQFDLTLAMYAAYAYALVNDHDGAGSIYKYVETHQNKMGNVVGPTPIPFDVALLAGRLPLDGSYGSLLAAPFCPMMSLGWALLDSAKGRHRLHPAVFAAGQRRLPAEWTTFLVEDSLPLIAAFKNGEIT